MDVAGEPTAFGTAILTAARRAPTARSSAACARPGAIVIGMTNVPELTIWPFTETATFGITRNPWDLDRTPGGSSGGSAAAVAAGLVAVATASDGGGSIRIPAACCGLVGLKPQRGRIPIAPGPARPGTASCATASSRARSPTRRCCSTSWSTAAAPTPFAEAAARAAGQAARSRSRSRSRRCSIARLDPRSARRCEEIAELAALARPRGRRARPATTSRASMYCGVSRYFRGIHDDARATAHPERLERRTRQMARIGRVIAAGARARSRGRGGRRRRAASTAIFDDVDVVLTPGDGAARRRRSGASRAAARCARSTASAALRAVPVAVELTGHPAMSRPRRALDRRPAAGRADRRAPGRRGDAAVARRRSSRRSAGGPTAGRRSP